MKFYKLFLSLSLSSAVGTTEYLALSFHLKKGAKCFEVLQPQTKCWDDRNIQNINQNFQKCVLKKLPLSNTSGVNMFFSLDRSHYSDIKKLLLTSQPEKSQSPVDAISESSEWRIPYSTIRHNTEPALSTSSFLNLNIILYSTSQSFVRTFTHSFSIKSLCTSLTSLSIAIHPF